MPGKPRYTAQQVLAALTAENQALRVVALDQDDANVWEDPEDLRG
jgi:hypothetical protein